jgi:hypothetical protein
MIRLLVAALLFCFVSSASASQILAADGVAEGKVVVKDSANGTRTLRPFTVQDSWEVRWDTSATISIWLHTEDGRPIAEMAATKKPGIGSTYRSKGGRYTLEILATGDWTVSVVQLP